MDFGLHKPATHVQLHTCSFTHAASHIDAMCSRPHGDACMLACSDVCLTRRSHMDAMHLHLDGGVSIYALCHSNPLGLSSLCCMLWLTVHMRTLSVLTGRRGWD